MTIEWKLFWTAIGTLVSLSLAVTTVAGVLWAPLTVGIAAVLALVTVVLGHVIVDACEMWREAEDWQRKRVWLWTSTAAVAYAAWTTTTVLLPVGWTHMLIMAATLALLSFGAYWVARGLEWRLRRVAPPRPHTDNTEALLGNREKVLAATLRRANIKSVQVLPGATKLRNEAGWQFRVRRQSGSKDELTPRAMEMIAIALAEVTGRDVQSDWVRVRKESGAGVYSITITNRDLMSEVIPYVDDPTPTSITAPALRGIEIDGREYKEPLDQHERDIGSSTYGKSSLIHLKLAHTTRSTDAITWVGGVQKLYDLVGPWVEPYHNKGLRPPLDWIAHGQTDTLCMMAAAMAVARWRQRQPMSRRQWRKIILFLDEFSFVAQSRQKIMFQGEWVDASWLISGLLRGAASGNVHVHVATQRSTIDHFGDKGGDVIANIAVNSAFRSKDWAEIGRLTNDYKIPVPNWPGEYYLFSSADPLNLKAPYIQTNDPSKPRLHNGATIADVSWARRHLVAGGLTEEEGLSAAGAAYAARHQLVNDRMMAYLTNGDEAEDDTAPDAQGETYDAVRAQLAAIAANAGLDLSRNEPPASEQRRPDAIIALLERTDSEDGLSAAQIAAELKNAGDTAAEPGVIAPTLSRMHSKGQVVRVGHGRYAAPTNREN